MDEMTFHNTHEIHKIFNPFFIYVFKSYSSQNFNLIGAHFTRENDLLQKNKHMFTYFSKVFGIYKKTLET